MRFYLYAFYDKEVKCFYQPQIDEDDPEKVTVKNYRAWVKADDLDKTKLLKVQLNFIGVFDDETGKFEALEKPQVLIDYEQLNGGNK